MFNMQATAAGAAAAYPEVYRQLMSVGLLGAIYRAREDAQIVHEAVETTLADPTGYRMCRAIALGMGGDVGDAGTTLAEHLERNPGDDNAKVAMAVSLMLGGDVEMLSIGGASREHSCAMLVSGEVHCWGANSGAQLGLGHTEDVGDDEEPDAEEQVRIID